MGQEDKFKKEVDRLAMALVALIGKVLKMNHILPWEMDELMAQFKSQAELDSQKLIELDNEPFIALLTTEKKLSLNHLRELANLFYELAARTSETAMQTRLRTKALALYQHVSANSKGTFYMDVELRIKQLAAL